MGRIVIPRYQRQRAQLQQRPKGRGYFADGFGPQEMRLVSQLADLAVAGGGQIARAVQISNREKEQAEAQADYDRKIQANAEERRAAAQGLVDATDIDFGVEEFFAERDKDLPYSFMDDSQRLSMPGALPGAQPDLVQPRPMQGGVLSPGVLARPGALAPEDLRPPVQPVSRYAPSWPEQNRPGPALTSLNPPLPLQSRPALGEVFGPSAAPALTMEGVLAEAAKAGLDPSKPINPLVREALARASGTMREVPSVPTANLQFQNPFSAADEYGSMQRRAEREQEMRARDFRQEAIDEIGPAPEAKPFRIADILAQAPSARTAEQRAMLLQAAADSPDIQAASLSDLAKGAYRDRAMKTVMKLFPKEDKEMSKLDRARYDQITARTELVDLQRKNLEQKMGDVSKAKSISSVVRRSRPKDIADAYDSAIAWTKHYEDKENGTGVFEGLDDAARDAKFVELVGLFSDANPDTVGAMVAKHISGKRNKDLRKEVLRTTANVGARYKAEADAQRKVYVSGERSAQTEGRQLTVAEAKAAQRAKAAETAHGYKKEIIGIKDKNTQRNIAVKHNNTLDQLSKRIELTEAMRSRLAAQNQRAKRELVALKASIKPQIPSAQEVSLRRQKARMEAAKKASRDPVATAYYNTYINGIDSILADVQAPPTGPVYDATTDTTQ